MFRSIPLLVENRTIWRERKVAAAGWKTASMNSSTADLFSAPVNGWLTNSPCRHFGVTWLPDSLHPKRSTNLLMPQILSLSIFLTSPIANRLAKPWHLNTHNVEHQLWKKSFISPVLVPLVRSLERKAAKKADLVIACAPADQEYFADLNSVAFVPNGVFPSDYRVDPEVRKSTRLELGISEDETLFVFTGSNFGPNRSALDRLQEFCSAERKTLSDSRAKILVVGTVGSKSGDDPAKELNEARIHQTGFVDSIQPYLAAADYALNPVFEGSGSNVKNSEYISSMLPILTQEFGTRGYQLEDKVSCLTFTFCLLYTSPSPRDQRGSRMPSSA